MTQLREEQEQHASDRPLAFEIFRGNRKLIIKGAYLGFSNSNTSWFILHQGDETSEIQMLKKNHLEKICPECEEEMNPVYDKKKMMTCWECTECGTVVLVTRERA